MGGATVSTCHVALARRSRPGTEADRAQARTFRAIHLLARLSACGGGRVGRTTDPPGLRWRPSPAWGHARASVLIPTRPAQHVRERRERVDTRDCSPCARRGSTRAGYGAPTKPVWFWPRSAE